MFRFVEGVGTGIKNTPREPCNRGVHFGTVLVGEGRNPEGPLPIVVAVAMSS